MIPLLTVKISLNTAKAILLPTVSRARYLRLLSVLRPTAARISSTLYIQISIMVKRTFSSKFLTRLMSKTSRTLCFRCLLTHFMTYLTAKSTTCKISMSHTTILAIFFFNKTVVQDRVDSYLCLRGYQYWFRKKINFLISNTGNTQQLYNYLSKFLIPELPLMDQQIFARWCAAWILSAYDDGSGALDRMICDATTALTCSNSC